MNQQAAGFLALDVQDREQHKPALQLSILNEQEAKLILELREGKGAEFGLALDPQGHALDGFFAYAAGDALCALVRVLARVLEARWPELQDELG
ncbi:hypothetical protein [Hydrogenophaga sp.]|uniref:hypothetical protein n=1 Tax=Hydrogenophaga sp. TaxID=1904254 RepID=UPI00257EE717|nr:hypothetical protein [Hydrogenophaga sp.]